MAPGMVVVLVCNRCSCETKVHNGECVPSLCHWCGGYLRYVEERVDNGHDEDDDDLVLGLA